jgi:hypothetical protein
MITQNGKFKKPDVAENASGKKKKKKFEVKYKRVRPKIMRRAVTIRPSGQSGSPKKKFLMTKCPERVIIHYNKIQNSQEHRNFFKEGFIRS